jgi:predicted acetyltransferase
MPPNRIVSRHDLDAHALEYAGVAIPSGRPEIVASHPDVRNRGYIRKIFNSSMPKAKPVAI